MKKQLKLLLILVVVIIILFDSGVIKKRPLSASSTKSVTGVDPENITYMVDKEKVTLINGIYQSKINGSVAKKITKYNTEFIGDIDDDGKKDIVVILTQQAGGAEIYYYVAAVKNNGVKIDAPGAAYVGDRIKITGVDTRDGEFMISYLDRAEGESMSVSPTHKASRIFIVTANNQLVEDEMDE